ncbi:MAG: DNA polymerase III subunit epsilon [Alphaproteobacteria bacterium]
MREVVLDTETTGLSPKAGHRIVEIGCIELQNTVPTGRTYHQYINPERDMPDDAFRIHGLSEAFLADKPVFGAIVTDFMAFIGEAQLVIHNAEFDMKFLNAELELCGRAVLPMERSRDTVALAKRRFPGAQVNLDALCSRFEIDNSARTHHGALLDAELLAEVYVELLGGKQPGLVLGASDEDTDPGDEQSRAAMIAERPVRPPRPHHASEAEKAAHAAFLKNLNDPLWLQA